MTTDVEEQTEFTFEQLDERAKDRARDTYRESVGTDDWWDYTYEDAQRMGALIGITINDRSARTVGGASMNNPDIYFELDRGGYATFSGRYRYKPNAVGEIENETNDTELRRIAAELTALQVQAKLTIGCTIEAQISHNNSSLSVDANLDDSDLDAPFDEKDDDLTQLMRDFASWIHKNLQAEWDYMNSNEAIDEMLQDGLLFDEDGARI